MKKLLLIGLVAAGLAFVPVQRSDAQISSGVRAEVLDFLAAITLFIQPTIIIIPMGTTCGHTTLTPTIPVLLHGTRILLASRTSSLLQAPSPSLLSLLS